MESSCSNSYLMKEYKKEREDRMCLPHKLVVETYNALSVLVEVI